MDRACSISTLVCTVPRPTARSRPARTGHPGRHGAGPGRDRRPGATDTLLSALRGSTLPDALAGTGARGYVTGLTAEQLDFRNPGGRPASGGDRRGRRAAFLVLLATFRRGLAGQNLTLSIPLAIPATSASEEWTAQLPIFVINRLVTLGQHQSVDHFRPAGLLGLMGCEWLEVAGSRWASCRREVTPSFRNTFRRW